MRRANARLIGRVVDDAGTPVGALLIDALDGQADHWRRVRTDAEGRFTFALAGGLWRLMAEEPDIRARGLFGAFAVLALDDGVDKTDATWVLQRANAHLVCQVLDDAGNPVNAVSVLAAESAHGHTQEGLADENGWVTLALVEGEWTLGVVTDAAALERGLFANPVEVAVTSGQTSTNRLPLVRRANREVRGSVRDSEGGSIAGIKLSLSAGGVRLQTATDGAGHYRFAVVDGAWDLSLDSDWLRVRGYEHPMKRTVTVNAGDVEEDWRVQPKNPSASLGVAAASVDRRVRLTLAGVSAMTYEIQSSMTLADWTPLRSVTVSASECVEVVLPIESLPASGFFRAFVP